VCTRSLTLSENTMTIIQRIQPNDSELDGNEAARVDHHRAGGLWTAAAKPQCMPFSTACLRALGSEGLGRNWLDRAEQLAGEFGRAVCSEFV